MISLQKTSELIVKMSEKICRKVCVEEKSPKDWSRMMVSPIHKKGDKQEPGNYLAIALLSIPGRLFARISLKIEIDRRN